MPLPTSHVLEVPGAHLHMEVRGSGPPLVLVGHPMGASGFALVAPLLATDFTVVAYDPRGFGRSTIEDPDQDGDPDLLADDLRRVLEATCQVPAHVLGSSGGAVTGLALLARHPGHVHTLVAHEPPLALLLPGPEADDARAGLQRIYDTFQGRGIAAAWEEFAVFTGVPVSPRGAATDPGRQSPEAAATSARFFGHGLLPVALYQPDLPALLRAADRVVAGVGAASTGQFPQRTTLALAECLGTPPVEFPGGHTGFVTDAADFAGVLRRCLGHR